MEIQLKIDRLKILLPSTVIRYDNGKLCITGPGYPFFLYYPISTPDETITDFFRNFECHRLLFYFTHKTASEHQVLSKYYSIVNFKPEKDREELKDVLTHLIKKQEEKELLLEEVLKSKTNIDGLIENRIRSFIYYNIKLI
jgi:hypothetical protein